eukprot:TRINITY_DN11308_c0_g1_i1.p1 TRINITY_DN11308_c0_g1~~TRINITY_DN11308_c0_g1_i1.p1  ORF type:complete len:132 (+),score=30.56 TRINITY_DN11308_c0_g1_i1:60-398(+)
MVKFALAGILWYPVIITGMCLTYMAAFSPTELPFPQVLGWVADLAVQFPNLWPSVFYIAVALHVLEAIFVAVKAIGAGSSLMDVLLWSLQTCLLGYASTGLFLKLLKKSKTA